MDRDCDYLLYGGPADEAFDHEYGDEKRGRDGCLLCKDFRCQAGAIERASKCRTKEIPLDLALLTGPMAPYVNAAVDERDRTSATRKRLGQCTAVNFALRDKVVSLRGDIHMQDVPPNGTWLSEKNACLASVSRLRLAGLTCVHLPELNRAVIEQKNDDGLLHLANKWLLGKANLSEAVELFGPFACDAMLAPVLHRVLRSSWIEERKELREANNSLKPGWAQEFYDLASVPKRASGSAVFACVRNCHAPGDVGHDFETAREIVDKMACCGYTPWSAVQAVRSCEDAVDRIECTDCKPRLLASCAFLLECAAVESSRERDWLVRNEAVVELCWILSAIHKPIGLETELLADWAETIAAHSIRYQQCKASGSYDAEALVVVFANDHVPARSSEAEVADDFAADAGSSSLTPEGELLDAVARNERFAPLRELAARRDVSDECFDNISTALDVVTKASDGAEARARDVETVAVALASCFPRVAESALTDLTFGPPDALEFWPAYVNPTRACYQLFRALAMPASPNPAYLLELLARGWRRFPRQTLERFVPMGAGDIHEIELSHYKLHFRAPLDALVRLGLVSDRERSLVTKALRRGVLPAFACELDSVPDRLVSSTLALAFAACGVRAFDPERCDGDENAETESGKVKVTSAGLLYFAAWYVLVYAGAVHLQPTLRARLLHAGTEADKRLCSAFVLSERDSAPVDYDGREIAKALRSVFRDTLSPIAMLRVAQLYVPELMAQLPYVKKLSWIPGSVKSATESRDVWFASRHGNPALLDLSGDTPFEYLGNIAHGLHSSIAGATERGAARPVARSLSGPQDDFDLWCDSLFASDCHDATGIEGGLRSDIERDDEDHYDEDRYEYIASFPCSEQTGDREEDKASVARPERIENGDDCDEHTAPVPRFDLDHSGSRDERTAVDERPEGDGYRGLNSSFQVYRTSSLARSIESLDSIVSDSDTEEEACVPVTRLRIVCKGLVVDDVANMGFGKRPGFLSRTIHATVLDTSSKTRPVLKTPCLTGIASTAYSKIDLGRDPNAPLYTSRQFSTLIEALWVLMKSTPSAPEYSETNCASDSSREPTTPEALAVMIHLAVKSFKWSGDDKTLAVCNDIRALCETCHEEKQFLPVVAVSGGIFGVNVALDANGWTYYVTNELYGGLWAPGRLCHESGFWYLESNSSLPVGIPRETRSATSLGSGTMAAYCRLNKLQVKSVPGDGYCGFHAAWTLLQKGPGTCDYNRRKSLIEKTVTYMMTNRRAKDEIETYLQCNDVNSCAELRDLLMKPNRWLSVDELTFVLRAHGKDAVVITEHSYPIVDHSCVYFLIRSNHYEPVVGL